jgi:sugar lactone lactonase YvrE
MNGTGVAAAFNGPTGVATDGSGNIYVADAVNNTIRKITSAGVVSTLAGTAGIKGHADGTGAAASFNYPNGVAVDVAGNVYVADSGNFTIRKITSAGVVTTLVGSAGTSGSSNGTGSAASFNFGGKYLSGIAVDGNGNVYLADSNNYAVRMITSAGVVTTLAGGQVGSADGTGTSASFGNLNGIVVDGSGNVYVADDNYTIRKITSAGVTTTIAGVAGQKGFSGGSLPASLPLPLGLALSGTSLYISASNGIAVIANRP